MALLTSELQRIKYELGYPVLTGLAEPYIETTAIFEQVVLPYLQAGASTTSSTAVSATSGPTPVTITLASGTGFATQDRIVVDVGPRQEIVIAQTVSGASLTIGLAKAHTGTYPVSVEGGEAMVREVLRTLDAVASAQGESTYGSAGIKKVDEVEFFQGGSSGQSRAEELADQRAYWRDELAFLLGVLNLRKLRRGAGAVVSVY